jgi:hypothetical protein
MCQKESMDCETLESAYHHNSSCNMMSTSSKNKRKFVYFRVIESFSLEDLWPLSTRFYTIQNTRIHLSHSLKKTIESRLGIA